MTQKYFAPTGGLPAQTELTTNRAVFTEAYAVLPRGTMRDIVTSYLPFWEQTRLWVIARPLSGFAETFSQYIVEVAPGGGSDRPEADPGAESVLFLMEGNLRITLDGETHDLEAGGYAFLPPGAAWTVRLDGRRARPVPLDPQGLSGRRGHRRATRVLRARDRRPRHRDARTRRAPGPPSASWTPQTCATTCT